MIASITCPECRRTFRVPEWAKSLPVTHDCTPRNESPHVDQRKRNADDTRSPKKQTGNRSPSGVGSHLLEILKPAKWFAGKQCGCESYARMMDELGPAGCAEKAEEIVSYLVKKANEHIPLAFLAPHGTKEAVARWALDEAIRRARAAARLEYVSSRRLVADLKSLATQLPHDLSGIVGVPRSGMIPASHLACHLHLPLYALHKDGLLDLGHGYRLEDAPGNGPLLIVDDTVCTGWSLRRAKKRWAKLAIERPAIWAGAYVTPEQTKHVDYYAAELANPHYLEWNLFNSVHTPVLACDFDGVLCYDLPPGVDRRSETYREAILNARPLHLVRRGELPLIVTARTEDMREATLQWLERWGVSVKQLVMWPHDIRERRIDAVAKWKAEQYAKSECHLFVESDDAQAQRINAASKRPVLCPASETIYQ